MKILVTGAKGFVGRNLVENLKNIRDKKDRTRPGVAVAEVWEYDVDTEKSLLDEYLKKCDFVFHLGGINRPKESSEFMDGNFGFTRSILDKLAFYQDKCPVMFSSSIQAALTGRYEDSEYGKSKLAGEELLFSYSQKTGSKVLVYRFPNLFGKWCRPNYNSAVATFCSAVANGQPYTVHDRSTELELLYIDDLVNGLLNGLEGNECRCEYEGMDAVPKQEGRYCYVPVTHRVTLGEIVDRLEIFKNMPATLMIPAMPTGSFAKKLYSTYLSYLPKSEIAYSFKTNFDERGSFTELIKTENCGQISVNVEKPGVTKGQHWHNSKWEIFIVVSGQGLIQERKVGINPETGKEYPVIEFKVTDKELQAVQMLPGYTHNIINLSKTEPLVTLMWVNEPLDSGHPDTFHENV